MDTAEELRKLIALHRRACNLDLRSSVLARANLAGLSADSVDLSEADLSGANLRDSHWTSSRFLQARCENSDWTSAAVRLCVLDSAHAPGARFHSARLEDSSAVAADFSRAGFHSAHLTETSFSRALLRESIFDDAEGAAIDFRGADLRSASLLNVRFDEADFRGADLRGANLARGRFPAADFRGSLLEGARFDGADLTGAMFDHDAAAPRPEPSSVKADAAALDILNQFAALLPAAASGAAPAETMQRVHDLVAKAAHSVGYSPEQQQAMQNYLSDLVKPDGFDMARLQQLIAALGCDAGEPPGEWKAWLEPFLKAARKERS